MATAQLSDERREYLRQWQINQRLTKNEVELPDIVNRELRLELESDLEAFFRKGFPDIFSDPFGSVQKDSIRREQAKLSTGGRNLNKLEPRGYGKSTRGLLARVWAVLCGHKQLCIVTSSSATKAGQLMRLIDYAVSNNEVLLSCWPELWAFHALQGNPLRAIYQTFEGNKTDIKLRKQEVQFADLGDAYPSSRSTIFVVPFEKTRGINLEGRRPDDLLMDDVQTTKDAISPAAVRKMLVFLDSDIAFLGSRKNPIDITHNGTVIQPDDFADQLCERKSFQTVRYKMVEQFSEDKEVKKLWEKYHEIRQEFDDQTEDDDLRAKRDALTFYQNNREKMDSGSVVTWDHAYSRKTEDYEISTIQAAYNFIQDWGEDSFQSECQNNPTRPQLESDDLTKDHIRSKQHGCERGQVPQESELLVCDIDVQGDVLFWTVAAANSQFETFIVDYGTFPDQGRRNFRKSKLSKKLSDIYKGSDEDSRIYQGVRDFLEQQAEKVYYRNGDGAPLRFNALAVDVKWNEKVIRRAIRDAGDARVMGYNGHGIGPTKAPMSSWKARDGEKKGVHWHLRAAKQGVRNFISDVNFWKSFCKKHFLIPIGQPGSLSVFKADNREHELYASHIKAETCQSMTDDATGRRVEIWKALPGEDNDWLDTTCGCLALLSYCGAECLGAESEKRKTKKRRAVTYV